MATTALLQRHAGEGETIAEAIRDCLDYGKDPEKTESGKYISAYECDPATVADEFLLAKASYAAMTGREQKKENNVLCYQIRQSFKACDPMRWVGLINTLKAQVEEIIQVELISK